jgi:glutathione S-transferase
MSSPRRTEELDMQLVGMLDSPFVRRVAITAHFFGLQYEHKNLSIFRSYEEFREINPLVKIPTLICDTGEILVDSTLIIEYLETLSSSTPRLMPDASTDRLRSLQIIGAALVAMEKVAQLIYETKLRPAELQYGDWIKRLEEQLTSAIELLEDSVGDGSVWFFGSDISQADITTAVAWRFVQNVRADLIGSADYPGLATFSARAEALPEFLACPIE